METKVKPFIREQSISPSVYSEKKCEVQDIPQVRLLRLNFILITRILRCSIEKVNFQYTMLKSNIFVKFKVHIFFIEIKY